MELSLIMRPVCWPCIFTYSDASRSVGERLYKAVAMHPTVETTHGRSRCSDIVHGAKTRSIYEWLAVVDTAAWGQRTPDLALKELRR
jgi:hypothetical protein